MNIYIASKYLENQIINQQITNVLRSYGYQVFLPIEINVDANDLQSKRAVSEKCYSALQQSNVAIFIFPVGDSVKIELGYALAQKLAGLKPQTIIFFRPSIKDLEKFYAEAMIEPYIDSIIYSEKELLQYLEKLKKF